MDRNAPNLFTALRPDVDKSGPLAGEVNCGVIMAPDGSFKAFSNGIDAAALRGDPKSLSEDQLAQLEMGQKLMAISLALSNEQIMAVLMDLVANSDVLDPERLKHVVQRH
ncbi:MAG: hypothetical protein EOQ56_28030 [Mesorhizobium sp.]|nr:MAG: hypothetical protein EOQ56_28030 [Mesorhizobium sp.]